MSAAPQLRAGDLRQMGRAPTLPFSLTLADGSTLQVDTLLRLLPGKRLVGQARWQGQTVLAKLFLAAEAARHGERERAGIAALQAAGLPTPALRYAAPLPEQGFVVLSDFLVDAESLGTRWAAKPEAATLFPALRVLGQMHAHGLIQIDLHLDNFLHRATQCWVIDGDGVRPSTATTENLALLLAQLPPACDADLESLLPAYAAGGVPMPDATALRVAVAAQRQHRLVRFLKKTVRDCTQFAVSHSTRRFAAVLRAAAPTLGEILAHPDAAIHGGRLLKDGGTCTVASASAGGDTVVIKRYNLKHWRHALSRAWRPSRAWHAWKEAHRLGFYGIATPRPLALVEERLGLLRGRAFLLTDYCPGENLLALLSPDAAPPAEIGEALTRLFALLHRLKISHGDLKATNLLWHGGEVVLIDLDATRQHRSTKGYARAWRRDRARLLRNWPAGSILYAWLDARLPPA